MRERLVHYLMTEAASSADPTEREAEFRHLIKTLGRERFEI